MREFALTIPELALVAGTRAAAALGLGLLMAGRLTGDQRRAAGWALLAVGAATTIPLAFEIFGKRTPSQLAASTVEPSRRERAATATA